jgi:hypothetical protein
MKAGRHRNRFSPSPRSSRGDQDSDLEVVGEEKEVEMVGEEKGEVEVVGEEKGEVEVVGEEKEIQFVREEKEVEVVGEGANKSFHQFLLDKG